MFHTNLTDVQLGPGPNTFKLHIMPTNAVRLWNLEFPALYICSGDLMDGQEHLDRAEQTFGFRWFAPEGIGTNAMFRLNGKRVVVRTSISWGFWPINGIFPTSELAEKQIRDAKDIGLNMLNFHRAIGQPIVLDMADELGLLYYEEPGGYKSAGGSFSEALMREKVLRMVKRDRSHPSLVIFSLINERNQREPFQKRERADMLAMHDSDPSRSITLCSSWASAVDKPEDIKAHLRPFDREFISRAGLIVITRAARKCGGKTSIKGQRITTTTPRTRRKLFIGARKARFHRRRDWRKLRPRWTVRRRRDGMAKFIWIGIGGSMIS